MDVKGLKECLLLCGLALRYASIKVVWRIILQLLRISQTALAVRENTYSWWHNLHITVRWLFCLFFDVLYACELECCKLRWPQLRPIKSRPCTSRSHSAWVCCATFGIRNGCLGIVNMVLTFKLQSDDVAGQKIADIWFCSRGRRARLLWS